MKRAKKSPPHPSLAEYYNQGGERDRLASHRLEKERTLQILHKRLPPPPALLLDVGGAAGVYAFPLTKKGYEVHLIDPIALHIEQARQHAKTSHLELASYTVGDARALPQRDRTADIVLLLGPLYHLPVPEDRALALQETCRVLKPGGLLFAAGISRFASLMDAMHKAKISSKFASLQTDLADGRHNSSDGFTSAYFHYPHDLKKEVEKSGFEEVVLLAIEGPVWEQGILSILERDQKGWSQLLTLLETVEQEESLLGASAHLLAVGRKKCLP